MFYTYLNESFDKKYKISDKLLKEEFALKKLKSRSKTKFLESIDRSLKERHWKFTVPGNYRNAIFEAGDEEDFEGVKYALMDICQYVIDHIEESEDFEQEEVEMIIDDYSDLLEELEYQDFEDEDECNYWLNELYDLMDNTDIFLGLRESLNESTDEVVVGLYGDEVDGIRSVSGLVQYFKSKGLKVSNVSGDMDYGWELNLTGNPRTIFLAVQNLDIPGYMSDSVDDFISEYRIDALEESLWTDIVKKVPELAECINEDTKKIADGKWVNKGKEGTHGEFRTKKEADAQRKAMFANGYKESLKEAHPNIMPFEEWVRIRKHKDVDDLSDEEYYKLEDKYDEWVDRIHSGSIPDMEGTWMPESLGETPGRELDNLAKYSQSDINQAKDNATIQQLAGGNERMTASLGDDYSTSIDIIRVDGGYKVGESSTVFPYITGARNSARNKLHHDLMRATGRIG